jgi:threonine aldolase
MKVIDLRSDTVTRPSQAMREAMANAEVGDDVYGEDPTVNLLQREAASRLGKEAALFVPSGTMGNQASLHALTRPGDVVLTAADAHVLVYESGAASALSGVQIQTLGSSTDSSETLGRFDGADVRAAINPGDSHFARTQLVVIENTHNRSGGRIFPFEQQKDVVAAARSAGLALHLDGARIFHAAAATGIDPATWAEPFDTVTFCLSKGLGAPVGSLICASRDVIGRVHRARKMMGGGMRQAGILAAAGLYALEHNTSRIVEDHERARKLAAGIESCGFRVESPPETNILMFRVRQSEAFARAILERDLLINPVSEGRFRAVTHLDVSSEDIDEALGRLEEVAAAGIR